MRILPINQPRYSCKNIQKINGKFYKIQEFNNLSRNIKYKNVSFGLLYSNHQPDQIETIKNTLSDNISNKESVGLYGPESKAKEKLIESLIRHCKSQDVRIANINILKESPNEISVKLQKIINNSQTLYQQTRQKTAIFVDNIDLANDNEDYRYSDIISQLQSLEHSKQKGIIWIWSAKDKDKVDPSLLRRTNDLILVQPSTEDNKKTWLEYLALLNKMPKTNRQAMLMSEALRVMPKVFPIKLSALILSGVETLKSSLKSQSNKPKSNNGLSAYQRGLNHAINYLSEVDKLDYESLSSIDINGTALHDFWLTLEGKNPNEYTQRTKEKEIHQMLSDKEKTTELISRTLDELQKTNSMIKSARRAYKDIIENEDELTQEQKDILIKQQDSKLFFEVVTNDLDSNDEIELELNTIKTLRLLAEEKETIRQNALDNIFNPARNIGPEDEDNNETANYVLSLLSQKAITANSQEKKELKNRIQDFEEAINSGDIDKFNSIWQEMVDLTQEYFETEALDDLTNRNIALLNSINQNVKNETNPRILSLINNPSLTIEQKEFISRYKDDSNFKRLIANSNVDVESTIEELVYFEAANQDLINNNDLDISCRKVMSDKFHEIDSNNKDINIQADRLANILNKINRTIEEQSGLISSIAEKFVSYADTSLTLQSAQLQELISINQNTFEIKSYTQALTRTKLVELEKNKYYKDIVDDIKELLPEEEQIDLKDFLSKVDELAKHEKNDKRKKKLIKAGLIIAGTVAASVGIYYFGPAIVAHLASQLPAQAAIKATASTAAKVGLAKSIGNSGIMKNIVFEGKGGVSSKTHTIMDNLATMNTANADRALAKIKSTIKIGDSQPGNISDGTVIKILKECGINPSDVS